MPLKFWDEAFLAATYLINKAPSKVINFETPLERLYQVKPDFSSLRVFGCACWPNLRPYNKHKLSFRSKECVFLAIVNLHKGFKCLDIPTGRIYISRDVTFDENVFPFSKLHNTRARLKAEILLLPSSLRKSTSGDELADDHVSNGDCTNIFCEETGDSQAGTSNTTTGASFGANLHLIPGQSTPGLQPTGADTTAPGESPSVPATSTPPQPEDGTRRPPVTILRSPPPRQSPLATSPNPSAPGGQC
jgi:hypothetical protein